MRRYKKKFETKYDDCWIGAGVTVEREEPVVTVVNSRTASTAGGDGAYAMVRIEQRLTFSVEVLVPINGNEFDCCGICQKTTPLPDTDGAQFILQNCDGGRICFPQEEDCEEERDSYPVTGWKRVQWKDDEVLACPECRKKISLALDDIIEKVRRAEGNPL